MPLHEKLVGEISRGEVNNLVKEGVPEDVSLEFREVYRPKRFLIRDQNRKRDMTYDEIMRMFQQTPQQQVTARLLTEIESIRSEMEVIRREAGEVRWAMQHDIAELLEIKDTGHFLKLMQEESEGRIGSRRFFRISATPAELGRVSAALDDSELLGLLRNPPNPHARFAGWDAMPLPPLRRSALGFENERIDFHHMKFIKNGHLEFWTEIDDSFCWQQDRKEMKEHPRLYPYAVVEHPVSFCRLYRALADHLAVDCDVIFQMQYWNVQGAYLRPYHPESIGFMAPIEKIRPLERQRLLFEPKRFPSTFDPDPSALELIKDLYYEFGYGREHVPFFDASGQCRL